MPHLTFCKIWGRDQPNLCKTYLDVSTIATSLNSLGITTAAHAWNSLAQHVTSAQSLPVFHSRLNTHLFRRCFPGLLLCLRCDIVIFRHVNRFSYLHTSSSSLCKHPSHLVVSNLCMAQNDILRSKLSLRINSLTRSATCLH